ncbi:MAG: thiamine diphosphokinase [Balneolaceae bacterium]
MRALIIAGGTPPTKKLLQQEIESADLLIGADSGGHVFLGYGFTPDIVIGDLDSFVYTRHEGINVLKDEDQETNDLEKALNYALKEGATECVVLGALGKRVDHLMKNLSVLQQFWPKFESIIFRDDYGDTFLVQSPYEPNLPIGSIISFFPVRNPVKEFTSTNVLYPLTNSILEMGGQDGTSNEITDEGSVITFKEGFLGVFVGNGEKMKKG